MALVKVGNRFPISTELIGPWDALLDYLEKQETPEARGMLAAVQTAKQQVVTLRNMLELLQEQNQGGLTDIADLVSRVAALENAPAPSSEFALMDETPTGTKNGSNALFSLSAAPRLLILELNGQALIPAGNDYTLTGATIRYVTGKIPAATDVHRAWGLV